MLRALQMVSYAGSQLLTGLCCDSMLVSSKVAAPEVLGQEDITPIKANWLKLKVLKVCASLHTKYVTVD